MTSMTSSDFLIVKVEQISHIILVFRMLTLNKLMPAEPSKQ